jgi:hypothetical protein
LRPVSGRHRLSRRTWAGGSAIALLLLGLALPAACRPAPQDAAPEIELQWNATPSPPTTGPVRLSLELTDRRSGRAVQGAEVRLEANMSHPGMEPVFATAREVSPGVYVARIELTMSGDWVLLMDARLRDGRTAHRELALSGVRAASP